MLCGVDSLPKHKSHQTLLSGLPWLLYISQIKLPLSQSILSHNVTMTMFQLLLISPTYCCVHPYKSYSRLIHSQSHALKLDKSKCSSEILKLACYSPPSFTYTSTRTWGICIFYHFFKTCRQFSGLNRLRSVWPGLKARQDFAQVLIMANTWLVIVMCGNICQH